ncbi:MAG: hypothetical protein IRY97_11165, partial [Thermomicrobiaceae bacterium]|nr:hypothetical protein [Thermomicrobiaceae bacterium]
VREALGHAPAVVREATDLAQALALARSLPVPGARRVVLLSDGSANGPDPLAEAAAYAARGIPIDVVPQRDAARDDLRVESVAAPGNVWAGDPVDLLAVVRSPAAGDATVRVLLDGREQRAQPLQAAEGDNSLSFELTDLAGGFHQIEVVVESATIPDPVAENDRYPVAVVVRDHPSALLVSDQPAEAQPLTAAWEEHGVRIQSLKPPDLPSRLSDLAPYDAIVLSDVSATEFSLDQLKAIQEHARSLGRGVIVLGGPHAYGAGSYANSELEAALPVKSRLENVPVRRKVSILLIVDRSASMSYDPLGGAPKMEMAKQAAIVAAKALQPGDEIAVLAFNDGLQWIAHRTTLNTPADTQAVVDQIGRIEP